MNKNEQYNHYMKTLRKKIIKVYLNKVNLVKLDRQKLQYKRNIKLPWISNIDCVYIACQDNAC